MISVVISTFNRTDLLKRAIDSVKKQTFKDFEIIVVDHASTDDYSEIKKIEGITYIRMDKSNKSQAEPKNVGIMASKGEYICFLDDDNTYREDHLFILHNEIKKGEYDVVYGDRMLIDIDTNEYLGLGVASDFNPDLLMQRNFIDTSDFIIRKDTLLAIGGWDERYKRMLDWNLVARLHKAGYTFVRIPVIITDYYINKDGLSHKDPVIGWSTYDVEIELPFCGHKVKEPKVAIYTLTYDRVEYTRECFETLYKTAGYEFDHYIWDNGSQDETVEYLKSLKPSGYCKKVEVHYSPDNKGISIASNGIVERIREHDYQIIGKSDNDAYYKTMGWLTKMVEIWKGNRKVALSCYIEGLRDHPGGAERLGYGQLNNTTVGVTKHLGGICHFVDASAYKYWKWDEESTLHGIQDLEFSKYLNAQGYGMGYLESYFCEHKDGTGKQEEKYKDYFERRKKEKTESYQRDYEQIQESESAYSRDTVYGERVKDTVLRYKDYFKGRVLDIGCNDGYAMGLIADLRHEVCGIDISPMKIKKASENGLDVFLGRMEKLPYKNQEFDTVFCSHTLEHSDDVKQAVSEIKRVSKRAIIIVPIEESTNNPGHFSFFKSGDEVKELFKEWKVLHEEYLERLEKEFVLIVERKHGN